MTPKQSKRLRFVTRLPGYRRRRRTKLLDLEQAARQSAYEHLADKSPSLFSFYSNLAEKSRRKAKWYLRRP